MLESVTLYQRRMHKYGFCAISADLHGLQRKASKQRTTRIQPSDSDKKAERGLERSSKQNNLAELNVHWILKVLKD